MQAKKLAEKYPEIKCESYGFGEERAFAAECFWAALCAIASCWAIVGNLSWHGA